MVTPKYLNFYLIMFITKLTIYLKHHDKGCGVLGMEKITFLEVKLQNLTRLRTNCVSG